MHGYTEIVTAQNDIRDVPNKWLERYRVSKGVWIDDNKEDIYWKLVSLDLETVTADDIAAVIGNPYWASDTITCLSCGLEFEVVARFEYEDERGSDNHLDFCYGCLREAMDQFDKFYPGSD